MVENIRYSLCAILITCRQPLGNTAVDARPRQVVVHIAKLIAECLIYGMYDIVVIYCAL